MTKPTTKTINALFNELVSLRIRPPRKNQLALVPAFNQSVPTAPEDWLVALKTNITQLETIAFDLRYKFGSEAAGDICREFSQQVRALIRSLKESILAQGRSLLPLDRALDNGITDLLLASLTRIKGERTHPRPA